MKAILIDPFARVVSELDLELDRDELLDAIDAVGEQLEIVPLSDFDHMVLESMAAGRRGQRFWRFQGAERVFAGKALIVGNDRDGTRAQGVSVGAALVWNSVQWLELKFLRWETVPLGNVKTALGIGEAIAQVPIFEPPEPHEPQNPVTLHEGERDRPTASPRPPVRVWSVSRPKPGGPYKAQLIEFRDSGKVVLVELEHAELEELRGQLPRGLTRVPRMQGDHDAIVESWVPGVEP